MKRPGEKPFLDKGMCTLPETGMHAEYLRAREKGSVVRKKAGEVSKGQSSQGRVRVWNVFCCFVEHGS